ncbi:MAG: response regulator [Deltaproteobacteria bacterium]|nr:response regulator [Deltaproteobacteria bacterium]MBW2070566.1 response regulator [Deltaproteobacteria bacterium]
MAECGTLLIGEPGCELATELQQLVANKGYKVCAVNNLEDVIHTLQCEKVHVLVLDVCLYEKIGFEALSIIKSMDRSLPIIVTTDENNPDMESRIRQKGIFYYHVKSFGMDELVLAIINAMARSSR